MSWYAKPEAGQKKRSRKWRANILAAATGCLLILILASRALEPVEQKLQDLRLLTRAHGHAVDDRIVIIDIDNQSLDALESTYGQWPWPRHAYLPVLEACASSRTVVFDILFAEPDHDHPQSDQEFAQAIAKHGSVVLPFYLDDDALPGPSSPQLASHALSLDPPADPGPRSFPYPVEPISALRDSAATLGFVNYRADTDGVLRKHLLLAEHGGSIYPSLSLCAWQAFQKTSPTTSRDGQALMLAGTSIASDHEWRFGFYPSLQSYPTISLADLSDRVATHPSLKDKMVFIGSSATGLFGDHQRTASDVATPGFIAFAWAADGLLSQRWWRNAPIALEVFLALALFAVPLVGPLRRPYPLTLEAFGCFAAVLGLAYGLLHFGGLMIHSANLLAAVLLGHSVCGLIHWLDERERRLELEVLEKAKQEVTDMLVHDLKNQLAPVTMSLSLLELDANLRENPDTHSLLNSTKSGTTRLAVMFNTLLDIRKMEDGRLQARLETWPVGPLFDELTQVFSPLMQNRNLSLKAVVSPASLQVRLDRELLHRMLDNVLLNAIHYARDASEMVLEAREDRDTHTWIIQLGNDGDLLPAEQQAQIFEHFGTGKKTRRTAYSGTGIGLSFCRAAALAQGGSIQVKSPWREGQGVQMVLQFPTDSSSS